MLLTVLIAIVFAIMAKNRDRNWLGWGVLGGVLYEAGRFMTHALILALFGRISFSSETSATLFVLVLGLCVGIPVLFIGGVLMDMGRRSVESVHSILYETQTRTDLTPGEDTSGRPVGAETGDGTNNLPTK